MLKDAGDTTLALALGIGLTVVLFILAGAIVGVKYYHKKWRQTKAKLSPKVSFVSCFICFIFGSKTARSPELAIFDKLGCQFVGMLICRLSRMEYQNK